MSPSLNSTRLGAYPEPVLWEQGIEPLLKPLLEEVRTIYGHAFAKKLSRSLATQQLATVQAPLHKALEELAQRLDDKLGALRSNRTESFPGERIQRCVDIFQATHRGCALAQILAQLPLASQAQACQQRCQAWIKRRDQLRIDAQQMLQEQLLEATRSASDPWTEPQHRQRGLVNAVGFLIERLRLVEQVNRDRGLTFFLQGANDVSYDADVFHQAHLQQIQAVLKTQSSWLETPASTTQSAILRDPNNGAWREIQLPPDWIGLQQAIKRLLSKKSVDQTSKGRGGLLANYTRSAVRKKPPNFEEWHQLINSRLLTLTRAEMPQSLRKWTGEHYDIDRLGADHEAYVKAHKDYLRGMREGVLSLLEAERSCLEKKFEALFDDVKKNDLSLNFWSWLREPLPSTKRKKLKAHQAQQKLLEALPALLEQLSLEVAEILLNIADGLRAPFHSARLHLPQPLDAGIDDEVEQAYRLANQLVDSCLPKRYVTPELSERDSIEHFPLRDMLFKKYQRWQELRDRESSRASGSPTPSWAVVPALPAPAIAEPVIAAPSPRTPEESSQPSLSDRCRQQMESILKSMPQAESIFKEEHDLQDALWELLELRMAYPATSDEERYGPSGLAALIGSLESNTRWPPLANALGVWKQIVGRPSEILATPSFLPSPCPQPEALNMHASSVDKEIFEHRKTEHKLLAGIATRLQTIYLLGPKFAPFRG